MNTQSHPHNELLLAFIDQPDSSQFGKIRHHLARCGPCRQKVFRLSALRKNIRQVVPATLGNAAVSVPDESVAAYVEGRLRGEERERVARQIHNDPAGLKAALHYATHVATHVEAVNGDNHDDIKTSQASLLSRLGGFFTWRVPVWASVPVGAVVMALAMIAYMPWNPPTIATFQDRPYLVWADKLDNKPGLGFFHDAGSRRQPAKPVNLTIRRHQLLARWDAVPGAKHYEFRVTYVDEMGQLLSKTVTATGNHVHIADFNPKPGRRGEWSLTGKAHARFHMEGGFVFSKRE